MSGQTSRQATETAPVSKERRPMTAFANAPRRGMLAALVACVALLAFMVAAPAASASFGLNNFDATFTNQDGTPDIQAGSHPFAATESFGINYTEPGFFEWIPDGELKDGIFTQVAGLVGDTGAIPY